jgi:type IV pilus assembly protein PilM
MIGQDVSVGLILGYTSAIIVLVRGASSRNHRIVKWGKENYGEGITRKSKEFPSIIKGILDTYLKGFGKVKIWCTIQSKDVETRFLTIPVVPEKHLAKAVFWAFKKELELSRQDIIFDYDVIGEREQQDKKEYEVLACCAPETDIEDLRSIFRQTGWHLEGITVTSFAFQNFFRTGFEGDESKNIATLFIGSDWSRIDIFSNGNLILSRDIKTGTSSMNEVLSEKVDDPKDDGIAMDQYLEDGEKAYVIDEDETAASRDTNVLEVISCSDQERMTTVFREVRSVADRLIRQVERTFEHYTMTTKGRRVERIYFTGPMCAFADLRKYSGEQLGIPVLTVNPFKTERLDDPSIPGPAGIGEQDDYVPATGLALSDHGHTLNFIHTYRDKRISMLNSRISAVICLLIACVLCIGFAGHKINEIRKRKHQETIQSLAAEIEEKNRRYGEREIISLSDRITEHRKRLGGLAKNLYGAAVLSEIAGMMPDIVKLNYFGYEGPAGADKKSSVRLRGVVMGPPTDGQKHLDALVERMKGSKLIRQVTVTRTGEVKLEGKTMFYFESSLEMYD